MTTIEAVRRSRDASLLNDFAVASAAVADGNGDIESLALEAVQRAWQVDRDPAIAWTRATLIEGQFVREPAIAAWRDYLAVENGTQWSRVAREHLSALTQPTDAEQWPSVRDKLAAPQSGAELPALVGRFSQDVRLWCEDELLPRWADAFTRGDATAPAQLQKVALLGDAIEHASGEREVAEAVASIRRAAPESLPVLARGFAAYGASRAADRAYNAAEAIRQSDTAVALLTPDRTPFAWRVRVEHAVEIYLSNDYPRALAELRQLPDDARMSNSCRGKLHAMIGIIDLLTGSYEEAAGHYKQAVDAFRKAGERDYEATLISRLAAALEFAGESADAQTMRRRALQLLERTGDLKHRHDAVVEAALVADKNDHRAVAQLFFDALVANDLAGGNSVTVCSSLMWRGAYRFHTGDQAGAANDLSDARKVCGSIRDAAVRERSIANLELAEASIRPRENESFAGLDQAIGYYEKTRSHVWLRTAYFTRARHHAAAGEPSLAENDFVAAIKESDLSRDKIDESSARTSFTASSDQITDGYIEFLLNQRRERDAFEVADRSRVRELVESPTARWQAVATKTDLRSLQTALPGGTALVEFRVLTDSVVLWVVTPTELKMLRLPVTMARLRNSIAKLDDPSQRRSTLNEESAFLYDALFRPATSFLADCRLLIVVPDDDLEHVPYSGLFDRVGGHYMVERRAIVVAPSAALYVESVARARQRSRGDGRTLVIEAPSGGEGVSQLPEAALEAESIARLYPRSTIVDGTASSGGMLLERLKDISMLQFVGHTMMGRSGLDLRLGDGPGGRLSMTDIAASSLPALQLVYLSACETDQGRVMKSQGSTTIARAFFAAGVPVIVATLWPVDDSVARDAAVTFHEHLRRGDSPAESLRQTQLALMAMSSGSGGDWAAFRVIGGGG
ncbi:MAG TPA: CHAT domain-containing tetratricopeptide repeat protein [Thermoanaerobaculia bacterium]|nr:CHAT domain-containing tetratricopeptide repeat protein [Thermoanaerobaculia bacterium]